MNPKYSMSLVILGMFLLAQFVGLFIIKNGIVPEIFDSKITDSTQIGTFATMLFSFVVAVVLFFFLIQYRWKFFIKIWFMLVILLTLGITINSIFYMRGFTGNIYFYFSLLIALPIVALKILRPSVLVHNITELLIYAGLGTIFTDILTPLTVIIFLVLVSFYDMWAVWHSGIMQKMAKFQVRELKIFNGFLVPYINSKIRDEIKNPRGAGKKVRIKLPVALLGGGDVVFTLISAGVFLKSFGWIPAVFIIFGGSFGLAILLIKSEKKKFYSAPAMPFITLGIFLSLVAYWLAFILLKLF
jgi:presenilin-like A22 family membrane protease